MTNDLIDELVLQADLAKQAKSPTRRRKAVDRLSQTAAQINRPKINAKQLRDALNVACVGYPEFADPVVLDKDGKTIHIDGSFDIEKFSEKYFERQWKDLS